MLEIKTLEKHYDSESQIKLKEKNFEYAKSYCILGPSGSGKSTLLNMIAGVIRPTYGEILHDGTNIAALSGKELDKYRSKNIGYISQDFKLFEQMTVRDNIEVVEIVHKPVYNAKEVLDWVGLSNKYKAKVKNLSGGEKQRVAIARALLNSPKVMLCDEPTGSLNQSKAREIMELIINLHKKAGNILVVVTHDDRMSDLFDEVIPFESLIRGVL